MTQFEAYLIRLMLAYKKRNQLKEMKMLHAIREIYQELKDKPDLTDEEMGQLADEIRSVSENEDSSRD